MHTKLKFSKANLKLRKLAKTLTIPKNRIVSFDLPAGTTCDPSCKFRAMSIPHKMIKKTEEGFPSCFAARAEAFYPDTWRLRTYNYTQLLLAETQAKMEKLIQNSLPQNIDVIRLHTSGDFFSFAYMLAWKAIAEKNPHIVIYAYTKRVTWLLELFEKTRPSNFRIVASYGSNGDKLISHSGLPFALAVASCTDIPYNLLPNNTDDYEAYLGLSSVIAYH